MQIHFRRALLTTALFFGTSAVFAASPATGLGQASPNATDVSTNASYHAYAFDAGGVRYIQINDANGNVLGAVGTTGGQYFALPMGKSAKQVSTPQQPATSTTASATSAPSQVYNDGTTTVSATTLSDGTTSLQVAVVCDPVDCNIKGAQ